MTTEQLYRIKYSGDIKLNTYAEMLINFKMLVPVEPCVHGNYAPHIIMHRSTLMCDGQAKQRKATKETT